MSLPVLYSFRRCPYAIRTRMTLAYAEISFEIREVVLKDKPPSMLEYSAKGTVPVLVLQDGTVIDESWDIMQWALENHDPDGWLKISPKMRALCDELVEENDNAFKDSLDKYKYSVQHPEQSSEAYREQCEVFLQKLDKRLEKHRFILGDDVSAVDTALFPFVRQFANVDLEWFEASEHRWLRAWLGLHTQSELFIAVMAKYPQWHGGDEPFVYPS